MDEGRLHRVSKPYAGIPSIVWREPRKFQSPSNTWTLVEHPSASGLRAKSIQSELQEAWGFDTVVLKNGR